jgi:predicted permease
MVRPLPYPEPERLVDVLVEVAPPEGELFMPSPSMADVRLYQQSSDVFAAVAGWGSEFRGRIVDGPEPERIQVSRFTEDYLSIHGVTPLVGRGFTLEDTQFGAPQVALLGYGYWQSRYHGRREVVGETLRLDDGVVTIIGVLPASFNAETPLARPLQVPPAEMTRRGTGRVSVIARLQAGISKEQASERLLPRIIDATPDPTTRGTPVRVVVGSELDSALSQYRTTVTVLATAVTLILLLACVNVAGLLLARGAARQPELAVRASLGANRLRLVRQLLTESIVLTVAAGAVGVFLAWLSLSVIVANVPITLPVNSPVTLNLRVLAATVALLVPTVILFGLVPAVRLSHVRLVPSLARGGGGLGLSLSRRGGQGLIAAEVALAVVLVIGAGLMLRSFARMSSVDLGFNSEGLLTMEVLPLERDRAAHAAYYAELLPRLRAIPGVQSAGLVDSFALGGGSSYSGFAGTGDRVFARVARTLSGYFETIDVRVTDGRLPTEADYVSGSRGVVINESAARALFPDGPAVGRQFSGGGAGPWTVLAVIANLRHGGPLDRRGANFPQVFLPLQPSGMALDQPMMVVLRSRDRLSALGTQLRQTAQSIGPRVLIERIRTADDWFGDRVITPRRRTVLLGLFGGLGLLLALVGVFGMTAYAVSRRTAEIGVRMVFGARPGQMVTTVLVDAIIPIGIGIALGLAGAAAITKAIESFLFQTAPTDAMTFAAVALVLVTTGCLAALIPAMRASRVDPAITLRAE